MASFKKIGILTSGGDAPGMNAAIYAVTEHATEKGIKVVGINEGYKGLLARDFIELTPTSVRNIISRGGTILNSARCVEFKEPEKVRECVGICRENGIDGIVTIGGDGTFRGATDLTAHGIPCVGIPATIDNDITSTESTIGFDTAMNTVMQMVDRLRDTCESHARCNVVEVMGRNAGDITLQSAVAVGATAAAIPEVPFDKAALFQKILHSRALGKRNFLVIVCEGMGADFAPTLAKEIQEHTGVETKFARLAHVVRGGVPTLRDRYLATVMGEAACDCLFEGKSNLVVCKQNSKIVFTDINYALTLDQMNKRKLKDSALDKYTAEQVEAMRRVCEERQRTIEDVYHTLNRLSL